MKMRPEQTHLRSGWLIRGVGALGFSLTAVATPLEPACAQSIQGRLLDAATNDPIAGATVVLLDWEESSLQRSRSTDAEGAFSLRLPAPGRYHLRASRLGYRELTSPPIDVREEEILEVELRLSTEAIPLAPLTVVSERPAVVLDDYLARKGYYERKAMYQHFGAHFLEGDEIQKRHPWSLVGVVRSLPGVRVYHTGGRRIVVANRHGAPLRVCVNGHPTGGLTPTEITLDEIAVPSNVLAIEIYPGMVGQSRFRCNFLIWMGVPPLDRDR